MKKLEKLINGRKQNPETDVHIFSIFMTNNEMQYRNDGLYGPGSNGPSYRKIKS